MRKTSVAIGITLMLCASIIMVALIGSDTALSIKSKGHVKVICLHYRPIERPFLKIHQRYHWFFPFL